MPFSIIFLDSFQIVEYNSIQICFTYFENKIDGFWGFINMSLEAINK